MPVGRLGAVAAGRLAATAADAGLAVALSGPAGQADALAAELPGAGVVVPAGAPGAEPRCRPLAGARVRLTEGRGAAADLVLRPLPERPDGRQRRSSASRRPTRA